MQSCFLHQICTRPYRISRCCNAFTPKHLFLLCILWIHRVEEILQHLKAKAPLKRLYRPVFDVHRRGEMAGNHQATRINVLDPLLQVILLSHLENIIERKVDLETRNGLKWFHCYLWITWDSVGDAILRGVNQRPSNSDNKTLRPVQPTIIHSAYTVAIK